MFANNCGGIKFSEFLYEWQGHPARPTAPGSSIDADNVYSQGNYEPFFAITNALQGGSIAGVTASIKNAVLDTTFLP